MTLLRIGIDVLAACGAVTIATATLGGIILITRGRRARQPPPWAPPIASAAARRLTYTWSTDFDPNTHADDGDTQVIPHTHIPVEQQRAR